MIVKQVHGPGADIDTLCVGPRYATRNVERETLPLLDKQCSHFQHFDQNWKLWLIWFDILFQEDFFGELHRMLAEMPEIQELQPVSDARVPVMRFKFNSISIDLLYANVALWAIPEVRNSSMLFSIYCLLWNSSFVLVYIFKGILIMRKVRFKLYNIQLSTSKDVHKLA